MDYDFDKVTAVNSIERLDDSTTCHVNISDEWMIGNVPHGGYILSIILSACRAHFAPSRPDPISISAFYLRPHTASVPLSIIVKDIKPGRYSIAQVTALQNNAPTLVATVTFGDLSQENGPTRITDPEVFPKVSDCQKGVFGRPAPDSKGKPFIGDKVDVVFAPLTTRDKAERRQWMRFKDGRHPDLISLGFFADAFMPILTNYGKDFLGGEAWFPTMELNVQFRARPPQTPGRWIGQVVRSRFITNGRHEVDAELYDENGQLLAIARQMALVVSWERNLRNAEKAKKSRL